MFDFLTQALAACAANPFLASAGGASLALCAITPVAVSKARARRRATQSATRELDQRDLCDWLGGEAYIHFDALSALREEPILAVEITQPTQAPLAP